MIALCMHDKIFRLRLNITQIQDPWMPYLIRLSAQESWQCQSVLHLETAAVAVFEPDAFSC